MSWIYSQQEGIVGLGVCECGNVRDGCLTVRQDSVLTPEGATLLRLKGRLIDSGI